MVKNHMKRLTMPKTWRMLRKEKTFITRPKGAHPQDLGVSINTFLKEIIGVTNTTKETKYLLTKQEVLINGTRKRSHKHQVGFLDIITIPSLGKSYRIEIDITGKLSSKEVTGDEIKKTLAIITKKSNIKGGKTQFGTLSGMSILEEKEKAKEIKTGDSIIISLPDKKILTHIKREKGNKTLIFAGKYAGKTGTIEELDQVNIKLKTKDASLETKTAYSIVLGTKKAEISIE